jgi:hypothetical protein
MNFIIAVLTPDQRKEAVDKVRRNYQLKAMNEGKSNTTTVIQDRINRVRIMEDGRVIHTVTIIISPIIFNPEPLLGMSGEDTKFSLGILYDRLDEIKGKLKTIQDNPTHEHYRKNKLENLLKGLGLISTEKESNYESKS